jgi:hypothetical protein
MIGPTRLGPNRLGPIRPGMRVVAFVAAVLIALVVGAPPATGHEDGQVQLYAAEMTVTPDSDGQRIDVLLVDLDSGSPAPGFAAGVTGIGPARPRRTIARPSPSLPVTGRSPSTRRKAAR